MSAEVEQVAREVRAEGRDRQESSPVDAGQPVQPLRASDVASKGTSHWASNWPVWLGVVLVVALIVAGRWMATHSANETSKPKVDLLIPVLLDEVRRVDVADYVTGIGNVQANASATVRVRVDGQLQQLFFKEGQDVKAGQLLARIDPAPLRAQLAVAKAQLARDQATLNNARADLRRYTDLVSTGLIARQTVETQNALVAQSEAVVAASQAQVDYAAVQLSYTDIKAPISGRIGTRLIDEGNMVRASEATGLVIINQIDPVTMTFTLPEDQFSRVNAVINKTGISKLVVQVLVDKPADNQPDSNQVLATGKLLALNNLIDTSSGTFQLKAIFDNANHALWPGQFVHARLVLGETRNALVIPAAAVQRGPEGTFVYRKAADGTAAVVPVLVSRYQDQMALIESGVQEHDSLVINGHSKLRPGSKIVGQSVLADTAQGVAP